MEAQDITLIVTTVFAGLMAGLFFSWSFSVVSGLGMVDTRTYLEAFQKMNKSILNPFIFIIFMSTAILILVLAYLFYTTPPTNKFYYLLTAGLLYLFGCFAVTFFGNIPMNNKLEKVDLESMSLDEQVEFRNGYDNRWNTFNNIRTATSLLAFVFLILSL